MSFRQSFCIILLAISIANTRRRNLVGLLKQSLPTGFEDIVEVYCVNLNWKGVLPHNCGGADYTLDEAGDCGADFRAHVTPIDAVKKAQGVVVFLIWDASGDAEDVVNSRNAKVSAVKHSTKSVLAGVHLD